MKKTIIGLIGTLAIAIMIFQSCKEKATPQPTPTPICSLLSPIAGDEIFVGDKVIISASGTETDGVITEVRFFVDNVKVSSVTNPPYNYTWDTKDESIGNHSIKATCFDSNNKQASDTVNVMLLAEEIKITDPRDGQKYKIVEIGNQTWFAQNLNFAKTDSWWYDNNSANGDIYGRLYTWNSAQDACPDGWRLPNDDDWKTLEKQLGMSEADANEESWRGTNEGDKMKSISGWDNNGNGTNSSTFNGLPAGFYGTGYNSIGGVAGLWTSSEKSNTTAWERGLDSNSSQVFRFDPPKTFRLSVRCIKN